MTEAATARSPAAIPTSIGPAPAIHAPTRDDAALTHATGPPVLGVPGRGEVPEMEDFVADTGTGVLTHLVDADGALWREYGVVYQPAFALLSPDGGVEVINGALGADGLREAAARVAAG